MSDNSKPLESKPCGEIQLENMLGFLHATFPQMVVSEVQEAICEPSWAGVDSSGVLMLSANTQTESLNFSDLDESERVILDQLSTLFPASEGEGSLDATQYGIASGFSRDWNSRANIIRKRDGSGPVYILIDEIL